MARRREHSYPSQDHDFMAHAAMLTAAHYPQSRCAITGLSALQLAKIGEMLTVDRIDSARGYVEGNMQLMTFSLNTAKGAQKEVPARAIKRLMWRVERLKHDRFSAPPTRH